MKIIWSPEAIADLEAVIDYLAQRNPSAAKRLGTAVLTLLEQLAIEQLDGPEYVLRTGERVRGWPCPPLRVYYQRSKDAFIVVRVYHQRREPLAP